MKLIERDGFLASLQTRFDQMEDEGHCVFVSGEAGIGKTSLVKAFRELNKGDCLIYQGACDALFTPRPLAPLYDIMWQMNPARWPDNPKQENPLDLFMEFFRELGNQKEKSLIIFEDIHWADEASLDFIKFFARRITQLPCLFILTYREDEIHDRHSLKSVLGQLPADVFTRMKLAPLSRLAVEHMSAEKGYDGKEVYSISGGNPFFVNEILASYSLGVPENIKDSILSIYQRQKEKTKYIWELLSILPTGLDIKYFEKTEPDYLDSLHRSLDTSILVKKNDVVVFKHELYRRTIEASLSPLVRIIYNKKVLDWFMLNYDQHPAIERIVHHAKNANEYDVVVHYAPLAAKQSAAVGSHIEAARLFQTAIEYYQQHDADTLLAFYDGYAYECYLTSNNNEAIIYAGKSLTLWREKKDIEKVGTCLRFLSRLWWFAGNNKMAEQFAAESIDVLKHEPASSSKAMAYSNMSQLKMLADQAEECIFWGEKAMEMAKQINDEETLCHALNNVGSMEMKIHATSEEGLSLLQQSLEIALKNSYHDHVGRAYCNIAGTTCTMKNFREAAKILDEGLAYCEERDLDAYTFYMISWKARLLFENGFWDEAHRIAENLIKNEGYNYAVKVSALAVLGKINMRRGAPDALSLLREANAMAFSTMELQRIIPVMIGLLEYEWINGEKVVEEEHLKQTIALIQVANNVFYDYEFAFWLYQARQQILVLEEQFEGYDVSNPEKAVLASAWWKQAGCPYMQALTLFEGNEENKKTAIAIVQQLGATAVYEKMKADMRSCGIKNIPRGIRESTRTNTALLTTRELEILALLKEGLPNKEIAARLFISAKTVDNHITSLLYKLEVNSRAKAVAEAIRMEII